MNIATTTVYRRIIKLQGAIRKALIGLMSEKNFDDITIQDISDRADVSRKTIYLHYTDKFDLLDKLMEEYINKLREVTEAVCEMEWRPATQICFEYLGKTTYFSSMLTNKDSFPSPIWNLYPIPILKFANYLFCISNYVPIN